MNNTSDIRTTVEAWADIVVKNWQNKMNQLDINDTYQLNRSLIYTVIGNSGQIPERVDFFLKMYGRFRDMGVGKGVKLKDVGKKGKREPASWYSKVLYAEVKKLSGILIEKYAHDGKLAIIETFNSKKS